MPTVDVSKVASALNLSQQRVQQLVKEGMPKEPRALQRGSGCGASCLARARLYRFRQHNSRTHQHRRWSRGVGVDLIHSDSFLPVLIQEL